MSGGPGPAIAVVGSINVDYIVRVDRFPRMGETIGATEYRVDAGGKGANQALAAARAGAGVAMVACVGGDAAGRLRLADLEAEGVDTTHVRTVQDDATGVAVVIVDGQGENSIIVVPGANAALSPRDMDESEHLLEATRVLVGQMEVSAEAVARAVELVTSAAIVVINCAPARRLPAGLLACTDVLVVNEVEADALLDLHPVPCTGEARDARDLLGTGARSVVITLGPLGARVITSAADVHVPAPKVDVVDSTGAGDAFVGALAAALAEGVPLLEAVPFAVAAGTATTQTLGASPRIPGRAGAGHAGVKRVATVAGWCPGEVR